MKFLHFSCIVLGTVLTISSCKKGDPGPQGPAGPAGATGQSGQNGQTGPQGGPGIAANVQFTNWIPVRIAANPDTPGESAQERQANYEMAVNIPALTRGMLDSGTVMMYLKTSDGSIQTVGNGYDGVYDSATSSGTRIAINFSNNYLFRPGRALYLVDNIFNGFANDIDSSGEAIRVIMIPGLAGTTTNNNSGAVVRGSAGAVYTSTQLRKMPYIEVARIFHLK